MDAQPTSLTEPAVRDILYSVTVNTMPELRREHAAKQTFSPTAILYRAAGIKIAVRDDMVSSNVLFPVCSRHQSSKAAMVRVHGTLTRDKTLYYSRAF